ncbi:MAG: formate dehydrogenase accessory sulfurtransferase FdhD [Crocinitomicaceae bacterium]
MSNSFEYEGFKWVKGVTQNVSDHITLEAPLQITINEDPFTVVMQTPGHEKELATGLLYAEDVIRDFSKVKWQFRQNEKGITEEILISTDPDNVADGYKNSRSLLSVSSCGICGKREIEDLLPKADKIKSEEQFHCEDILQLFRQMEKEQTLFQLTGGCHGIAAFDAALNLLSLHEDIGRHNALDKVVGSLLLSEKLREAKIITVSGRTSYEMVSKSFRAKIPIIAGVSAPSSLAIDFAKEYNMTLLAFARHDKITCYSGPHRVNF